MNKLDGTMIAALERLLLERRKALSGTLRTRLQVGAAGCTPAPGSAGAREKEEVRAALQSDSDVARLGQECRELEAVELALARVCDGSYGRCGNCGGAIPLARLRAQPATPLCLACQQEREHHYRIPSF